jgi:hypothetical protein
VSLTVEPIYLSVVAEHGWDPQLELRPKLNLEALVASSYTRPRPDPHAAGSPTSQGPSPGSGSAPAPKKTTARRSPRRNPKANGAKKRTGGSAPRKVNDA